MKIYPVSVERGHRAALSTSTETSEAGGKDCRAPLSGCTLDGHLLQEGLCSIAGGWGWSEEERISNDGND